MKNHYFIEQTDTFGGEANYCWDAVGACVCYFVEWIDAADVARLHDNYSEIEVIQ